MTSPTITDEYTQPIEKRERNGGFRAMNESTKGATIAEDSLYAILNRLGVMFDANLPLTIPNEVQGNGLPVVLKPDAKIYDKRTDRAYPLERLGIAEARKE